MNPTFKFREIETGDLEEVFELRVATWHNDNGRQELLDLGIHPSSVARLLQNSHKGWLCESDAKIVGFAIGDESIGEIWVIAVLKEYEGCGIGKKLMQHVETWLFENDWEEIWLTTDMDEELRAVGFYRRLGWQDWKFESGDRFMRKQRT